LGNWEIEAFEFRNWKLKSPKF